MTTAQRNEHNRIGNEASYIADEAPRDLRNQPVESVLAMAKDMLARGMEQEARALVAEWRQYQRGN